MRLFVVFWAVALLGTYPASAQMIGRSMWAGKTLSGGTGACVSNCVTASSSQNFFDSLGIVAQPNLPGTPADAANFITQVEVLGIKHVRLRATLGPSNQNGTYQAPWTTYNALASAGFTNDFVWSSADWGLGDPSTWAETPLNFTNGVSGIASYEGTNSPNASCGGPSNWYTQQQGFMGGLYRYLHNNSISVPLLAPGLGDCGEFYKRPVTDTYDHLNKCS
jgi:hypothetical protein